MGYIASILLVSKAAILNFELTKCLGIYQYYHWIHHPHKHGFRHQNLVSISPINRVIGENVIPQIFVGGHFKNGRHTGSPSQFGDCGIQFTCSKKSQEQHTIGLIRYWRCTGGLSGPWTIIHDIKPVVNYRFELIEGPSLKVNFLSSP